MKRLLRVGVIGAGQMGRHHIRNYNEMPQVKLAAIADVDKKAIERTIESKSCRVFADYHEMLNLVDAVTIAVPTTYHYQITKDFLEHNVHVLVEKPLTKEIEQGEDLSRLAKEKNLVLQVGHIERFNPAVQEVTKILHNPIFFEAHRMGPWTSRNLDVGVTLELMIHDIDIIMSFVKCPVIKVQAVGKSVYSPFEDIVSAQLLFADGCFANLSASRVTVERIRTLEITQQESFVHLDYVDQNITLQKLVRADDGSKPVYRKEVMLERPYVPKGEPLRLQLEHFISCINNKQEAITSGQSGVESLKVAYQIINQLDLRNNYLLHHT